MEGLLHSILLVRHWVIPFWTLIIQSNCRTVVLNPALTARHSFLPLLLPGIEISPNRIPATPSAIRHTRTGKLLFEHTQLWELPLGQLELQTDDEPCALKAGGDESSLAKLITPQQKLATIANHTIHITCITKQTTPEYVLCGSRHWYRLYL